MSLTAYSLFAAHPIVHVNAALNTTATILLLTGFFLIKKNRVEAHKRTMMTAFLVSVVFLSCYLWYHYQVKLVKFTHPGVVRYIYYLILGTHVPLAMTVPFLAIWQIYLGYRALGCCTRETTQAAQLVEAASYREKHIRWARITFPVWLYVSITGIIVYVMLYHLWPPLEN